MKIYVSNLLGERGIYSVAKREDVLDELLKKNKYVLYIKDGYMVLYPQDKCISLSCEEYRQISKLIDFDVVNCQDNGVMYRLYSDISNDNAIVVTSKCNSNCLMCPCSENARKIGCLYDIDYLKKWICQLPSDAKFLTITGGEPTLLKNDFFGILKQLRDKFTRTEFLLLTNGRAFSNLQFVKQFSSVKPNCLRIGIPIYAPTSELHDYITQVKGSWEQATSGIKNLLNLGCDVELRIVVSKLNYLCLDGLAEYIRTNFNGLVSVNFMGLEMLGNAAKNKEIVWIDYETAFNYSKGAIKCLINSGFDVNLYNFPLCSVDEGFWPICRQSISDYKANYNDECESCSVKGICGGVFESTLRFCNIKVKPIG